MLQHGKDRVLDQLAPAAAEGKAGGSQADVCQVLRRLAPVKSDPQIGPGLVGVGLIKGLAARRDEKALPGFQLIGGPSRLIDPLSRYDIVEDIAGPDGRAEAVARPAFLIAAEA